MDLLGLHQVQYNLKDAKFYLKVVNELKTRGVNDILIAVARGVVPVLENEGKIAPGHAA